MNELLCQDCGHPYTMHYYSGCNYHWESGSDGCECKLDRTKALADAQRASAANYLVSLRRNRDKEYRDSDFYYEALRNINVAIAAYRAVGILKGQKP